MKRSFKAFSWVFFMTVALAFIFQNCSAPMDGESGQSSYTSNLPFAYETTLDTLAYMSCAGGDVTASPDAIWTFRAGSFGSSSGLRLSPTFMDKTKNFSPALRAGALAESAANAGAYLQLALRPATDLMAIWAGDGGTPVYGKDYDDFIGPLDHPAIASKLAAAELSNPERINYFQGLPGLTGRNVEAKLHFNRSEDDANGVRGFLSGPAFVAMTYSSHPFTPRQPAGASVAAAYGRGYKVQFNYADGESVARVLSSVQEVDLETGQAPADAGNWTCPTTLRLRVARTCSECLCGVDVGDAATLEIIRRVLRTEHWYVDLTNRCVKQKTMVQQCYPEQSAGNYSFVSICVR